MSCFTKSNKSANHSSPNFVPSDFFRSQSELIKPVSPQAAQLGIFLIFNFSHHFIKMHLLLRDLIKEGSLINYEGKVGMEKSPVPGGKRTLGLTNTRRVFYLCATTAMLILLYRGRISVKWWQVLVRLHL